MITSLAWMCYLILQDGDNRTGKPPAHLTVYTPTACRIQAKVAKLIYAEGVLHTELLTCANKALKHKKAGFRA